MKNLKSHFIILVVAVLTGFLVSCEGIILGIDGDGPVVSQDFSFTELQGISSAICGDIYLTQSDEQKVTISAQQNIIDNMKFDVNNGVLHIEFDRNVHHHEPITIYMSVNNLTEVKVSGSGNVNTTGAFTTNDALNLSLSGSGNFNVEANAPEIYSGISGSGDFTIKANTDYFEGSIAGSGKYIMSGAATVADYSISGSGEIRAFELETGETRIHVSGSGDSRVTAYDKLAVSISGSGDVYYKGTPQIDTNISGSGNIRNAN